MASRKTKRADKLELPVQQRVQAALDWLKQHGTQRTRDGMARFGIPSDHALGVPMGSVHQLAKRLGRDHELAGALWDSGCYEARLLAAFVGDPAHMTAAQMDRWCRDFDNWAVCDTVCFKLFDRSPHAWRKVAAWAKKKEEFVKRAAFALLASLALHDKETGDAPFLRCLPLIERAAEDERNFVKKAVSWALRAIGRRNPALNEAAVSLARRLATSAQPAARWVGKDAFRELTSAAVIRRLGQKRGSKS